MNYLKLFSLGMLIALPIVASAYDGTNFKDEATSEFTLLPSNSFVKAKSAAATAAIDPIPMSVGNVAGEATALTVFPNFTSAATTITGEGTVEIFTATGARVASICDGLTARTFDASALAAGHYIVRCGSQSARLIVM